MRYLIQNRREFAISVGFFVMTAINLIRAVRSKDMTEEVIIAVVYALLGVLAWFYNMPTSEENCRYTGIMRLEKEKPDDGEDFFDEPNDIDEGGEDK